MRSFFRCTAVAAAALCAASAHAATYYVNTNSIGDGNSGTSASWPWKTLANVNDKNKVVSGDTVYFFRGGVWNETLKIKDGVTYGAYGTAANKPVISGSRYVGGLTWARTSATSNIWVATTNAANANIETGGIRHLHLNGVRLTRARFPNVGQGTYFSTTGVSRYYGVASPGGNEVTLNVGSNVIPAGAVVAGSTAFVRTVPSDIFESTVTGWAPGSTTALQLVHKSLLDDWNLDLQGANLTGVGYWLENQLWMLNAPGEWYFENPPIASPSSPPSVHKLYVWMPNGASPAGQPLYASSLENAVRAENVGNFAISDIELRETLSDAISMNGISNATLTRVDVRRSGRRGVSIWNSSNVNISYLNVQDSYGNGLWLGDNRGGATASQPVVNANVTYSTINNSGQNGLGMPGVNLGLGGSFLYNTVSNSASAGIIALRDTTIKYNTVLNSCTDLEDCGAIYVAQPAEDPNKLRVASPTDVYTSVKYSNNLIISNNIVVGGNGNPDGTRDPKGLGSHEYGDVRGIYLDDYTNGVTVSNNYVSGMQNGIMLHTAFNNTIQDNLVIGNRSFNLNMLEELVKDVYSAPKGKEFDDKMRFAGQMKGNVIRRNAMVASKDSIDPLRVVPNIVLYGNGSPTRNFASFDLNRYATVNPNDPTVLVYNYGSDVGFGLNNMTLASWQTFGNHNDVQSSFRAFRTDGEAYGFYTQTGAATRSIACPAANSANCNGFINLATGATVTFPVSLPASTSIILIR